MGIAYVVSAWLLLQVADAVLNNSKLPGCVFRTTLLVLATVLRVTFHKARTGVVGNLVARASRSIKSRSK